MTLVDDKRLIKHSEVLKIVRIFNYVKIKLDKKVYTT